MVSCDPFDGRLHRLIYTLFGAGIQASGYKPRDNRFRKPPDPPESNALQKAALMFILFHKRVCGPLTNSLLHHRPDQTLKPASKVETAYHQADHAIEKVLDLLAA